MQNKSNKAKANQNLKNQNKRYLKKSSKILVAAISSILILGGAASGTAYYFISRQNNVQQTSNELINNDKNLIIGSWNALNFISSSGQRQITNGKTDAIAEIINFLKYDLIGILEINKDGSNNKDQVDYLMQKLNSNSNGKKWAKQFSGNLNASPNTAPGQVEQVLILYNENLLSLKKYWEYSNPENDGLYYVRPPYGASFSYKTNPEISFGVIFNHFDSPGIAAKTSFTPQTPETKSTIPNQGTYEVHDSWFVTSVLEEMKNNLNTNNLIFMADTNIRLNNQKKAFNEKELSNNGYLFAFDDSEEYKTSLSTTPNNYANPYDKIIYKLDANNFDSGKIKTNKKYMQKISEKNDAFIFNLWKAIDYEIITKKDQTRTDSSYIRSIVSDHAPVGIPVKIK